MAFKFRDLMIDVLPRLDPAHFPAYCPAPTAVENQVFCPSPSFLCPAPSAIREAVMLCPSPSAFQIRPLCANPSVAENLAGCPQPSAAMNLCPSPSAPQNPVGQAFLCPPPSAVAQAAGFDDTSLQAMAALKEQLQKALAQVEEQEKALQANAAAPEAPKP